MAAENSPHLRENQDNVKNPDTPDRVTSNARVSEISSATERLALGQIEGAERLSDDERAPDEKHDSDTSTANTAIVVARETSLATTIAESDMPVLLDAMAQFRGQQFLHSPNVFHGNKTAVEYGGKVVNWSTVTRIVDLPTGQKVFVVYRPPLTQIHVWGDNFNKRRCGMKMQKANLSTWAETFKSRSNIPVLHAERDMVVLPFVPNVNLSDVFFNNNEIRDWGECEWAKDVDVEKKFEFIRKIIRALKVIHNSGKSWGDVLLDNVIADKDENVHICDPETTFPDDVPFVEQKASDLKLSLMTACGALLKADGLDDFGKVIAIVEEEYGDDEVIQYLREHLCGKLGVIQRIFHAIYNKERFHLSYAKYMELMRAIKDSGIKSPAVSD
jgi:hypothetical protein